MNILEFHASEADDARESRRRSCRLTGLEDRGDGRSGDVVLGNEFRDRLTIRDVATPRQAAFGVHAVPVLLFPLACRRVHPGPEEARLFQQLAEPIQDFGGWSGRFSGSRPEQRPFS